jgi:type 1 glutamine amidotransferase
MTKRIVLIAAGAVLGFCLIHAACTAGQEVAVPKSDTAETISVMILDGQMAYEGHKWAQTTPVMKAILQSAGRFAVDVVTSPEKGKPNADFRPPFEKYDVIVMNYEGDDWPADTQEAFVRYMSSGGGLVVVHAADNAFGRWPPWNEMIGFGGWGGRDEKSGPMIWWQDGKIVMDDSPGPGGYHGNRADWPITIRDPNHPITRGLPLTWMHGPDELYSKMRGPGKNMHVLATGRQSPDQRGTGRDEICLFTVDYGKGRVFHTTLGHDAEAMSCVGFIVTLQRGTEWAATGKVTLTEVPADFPTETQTSKRPLGVQTAEPQ